MKRLLSYEDWIGALVTFHLLSGEELVHFEVADVVFSPSGEPLIIDGNHQGIEKRVPYRAIMWYTVWRVKS